MAETSAFIRYGQACFKRRGLMFPAAVLLFLIPSPPLHDNAVATSFLGIALALIGQWIRVGTIGLEYIIRGGKDHHVFAERLVTGGLYAHVRNPMYFGNTFLLLGLAVASNSWVFFLGGIALGVAVHAGMIGAEEHFLRAKFGADYEKFCRDVPRLIPAPCRPGSNVSRRTPVRLAPRDRQGIHAADRMDVSHGPVLPGGVVAGTPVARLRRCCWS